MVCLFVCLFVCLSVQYGPLRPAIELDIMARVDIWQKPCVLQSQGHLGGGQVIGQV